jgi:hypothetical protein
MKPEEHPRESLEARLRALPQPATPADLEARLLAGISAPQPIVRRSQAIWIAAICSLAAVTLLAMFALLGPSRNERNPSPTTNQNVQPQEIDDSTNAAPWLQVRNGLNGSESTAFTWPLEEISPMRASTSIPADLLD